MKMRSLHPWNLALLLLLALPLLALFALVLVDVFDTRLFRTFVAPKLEERLGREVQVAELDMRWDLPLQVRVADLNIANAPWGQTPVMLSVPEVSVTVDPMQLLSGPPFAHVELRDPRIVVETSDSGALNWTMNAPHAANQARGGRSAALAARKWRRDPVSGSAGWNVDCHPAGADHAAT
ncbi:MAG TPA: AsmA family protein [Pseudomonadales bacterium]